jgi:hypothetical protein
VIPMASTIPAEYLGTATVGRVTAEWNPERAVLDVQTVSA